VEEKMMQNSKEQQYNGQNLKKTERERERERGCTSKEFTKYYHRRNKSKRIALS
jgi:hypothetical protein